MRGNLHPYKRHDVCDVYFKNRMAENTGNLLFLNSMVNALSVDGAVIDMNYSLPLKKTDLINAEYQKVVLPYANAFKESFAEKMKRGAEFVRKLKIPCIVPCIGIQDPGYWNNSAFAKTAKAFIGAVLNHSATIGVRGEVTADCLKRIGFDSSKIDVIGCPSMFMYGKDLPQIVKRPWDRVTRLAFNITAGLPDLPIRAQICDFMAREIKKYRHPTYIAQVRAEMGMLLFGDCRHYSGQKFLRLDIFGDYITGNHMKLFIDHLSWSDYFRNHIDVNFGPRIHGAVAGLLGGVPSLVLAHDLRTKELCDYHEIPYAEASSLTPKTTLADIYDTADYTNYLKNHPKRLNAFHAFLRKNEIESIFDHGNESGNNGSVVAYGSIDPVFNLSRSELIERLQKCHFVATDLASKNKTAGKE